MHLLFLYYLSYFLFCFLPITSSTDSSSDHVDPNDPHISDLLVSHYYYSKQHNMRQFSPTRVQPCSQAPSSFESARAIVNVFSVQKLNASKLGPVKHTLNVKILSVLNPITKTTVMIVLIAIRKLWNALALLTIRIANVLS